MKLFCEVCNDAFLSTALKENHEIQCQCGKYTFSFNDGFLSIHLVHQTPLFSAYSSNYAAIAQIDLTDTMQPMEQLLSKAHRDLRNLGSVSGKRILEVGPGQGHLASLLVNSGAKLTLVDVIPEYLVHIRKKYFANSMNVSYLVGDIQNLGLRDSFDVVILCDVLEHLFRPSDALFWAHTALRNGGILYVRVPSYESNIFYSQFLGYKFELVHLRTYTKESLRRELTSSGFHLLGRVKGLFSASRIPRNFLPGITRYWRVKRKLLDKNRGAALQISLLDRIIEGSFNGKASDRHKSVNLLLGLLRMFYTLPSEIYILCKKKI